MARRQRAAGRTRAELAAVHFLALLVHVLAAVAAVLAGPWKLMWFLPAMLGSLVAVWCVRYGVRWADAAEAEEEARRAGTVTDPLPEVVRPDEE
ncbi:hypothetical protein [Streptomyces viridosporus]|uniref:Uncharacterized protein n=1 Tax=Streptomyces viridosporus T7A TaxID=665577 RepID=A0ABX6APG3_STRVD|nr:hypothetical protein [Streptomyces viridosporus]QEU89516.1 hypothetical protein CP969_30440 [Streptomyces viridosporus T7A]